MSKIKKVSAKDQEKLLLVLQERFEKNMHRHKGVTWAAVEKKCTPKVLRVVYAMELTGGEPDIVLLTKKTLSFVDCSPESPSGRRSLCYDRKALNARKEHKPKNSALDMASEMGIEILTEEQYRTLQEFGKFDLKTSSWIMTPDAIRKHGGALFCDRRYDAVFTYHNGAESYYAARGFRGMVSI